MKIEKKLLTKISGLLFLVFISLTLFINLVPVSNASLLDEQEGLTKDIGPKAFGSAGAPKDIRTVVARVIFVFLGLLGIVFTVLILWSGFKWMTAQGDSGKVEEAKDQLRASVIGLAIILAAWGITIFVFNVLLRASNPNVFIDISV